MTGYLLDTNHLSRAVTRKSSARQRIVELRQRGVKVGTCVPVLCEIEAGIQQVNQPDVYRLNLQRLLRQIRVWPIDPSTARIYGIIHHEPEIARASSFAGGHDARCIGSTNGGFDCHIGSGFLRAVRNYN